MMSKPEMPNVNIIVFKSITLKVTAGKTVTKNKVRFRKAELNEQLRVKSWEGSKHHGNLTEQ